MNDNHHLQGPYTSPERDREQAVLLCLLLLAAALACAALPLLVAAARVP